MSRIIFCSKTAPLTQGTQREEDPRDGAGQGRDSSSRISFVTSLLNDFGQLVNLPVPSFLICNRDGCEDYMSKFLGSAQSRLAQRAKTFLASAALSALASPSVPEPTWSLEDLPALASQDHLAIHCIHSPRPPSPPQISHLETYRSPLL